MKLLTLAALAATLSIIATTPAGAAPGSAETPSTPTVTLNVGDRAPAFEAVDADGKPWKSADRLGKKTLVVYFYPAAMTGGCTAQACAFRDDQTTLTRLGAEVVGISGDTPEGLAFFRKAHDLNFTLLSDHDGAVARRFGVPLRAGGSIKKELDGKEFTLERGVSAARWTFVIDRDGRIVHKNNKVAAAKDSREVIGVLEKLNAPAGS